jgi:hypothetical protein
MSWKKVHEDLSHNTADHLHRLKIEGGWLYRNILILRGTENVTMVFVPDNKDDINANNTR